MAGKTLKIQLTVNNQAISTVEIPIENSHWVFDREGMIDNFKQWLSDYFMTEVS